MNLSDITNIRLINQQILASNLKTPSEIVKWMGAMQAQDYQMAKWAVGLRLPGSTDNVIESAINKGEILRTHLMRPTWHFVSPNDIHWLLQLTAQQIKNSMKSRNKQLELTEAVFTKSNRIIEKALANGHHLSRKELIAEIAKAKIATDNNRPAHLLMQAELDGLICSGISNGKELTYALLEERIPKSKTLKREEALAKLAERYFSSHGPTTVQDFSWWSGLSVKESRQALEMVKDKFIEEKINEQVYWLPQTATSASSQSSAYLLPAFDEYIISYRDRTAALPFINHKKAVSNNGIFRPMIIINGQVYGIWKRNMQKNHVLIETQFFEKPAKSIISQLSKAAKAYGKFLGQEVLMDF